MSGEEQHIMLVQCLIVTLGEVPEISLLPQVSNGHSVAHTPAKLQKMSA